jgi:DNA-directed RNA polymerase beta subunit
MKFIKCNNCEGQYSDFVSLDIPYAFKLLIQELQGMMITPKLQIT